MEMKNDIGNTQLRADIKTVNVVDDGAATGVGTATDGKRLIIESMNVQNPSIAP